MFDYDWRSATPPVYLPAVFRDREAPLISEVYYAVGREREWVEVFKPTSWPVDLSPY